MKICHCLQIRCTMSCGRIRQDDPCSFGSAFCGILVLFLKYGESLREMVACARYRLPTEKRMRSCAKEGRKFVGLSNSDEDLVGESLEELADELTERREIEHRFQEILKVEVEMVTWLLIVTLCESPSHISDSTFRERGCGSELNLPRNIYVLSFKLRAMYCKMCNYHIRLFLNQLFYRVQADKTMTASQDLKKQIKMHVSSLSKEQKEQLLDALNAIDSMRGYHCGIWTKQVIYSLFNIIYVDK